MIPKVQHKSAESSNTIGKKSLHLFPEVFYAGSLFRQTTADFISKQLLSLFADFYPLVKH